MARGKLFEYAVLYHPRKKEKDADEKRSVLITSPTTLLASDEKEVAILAARNIPEQYIDKLEDVEIVVRPF